MKTIRTKTLTSTLLVLGFAILALPALAANYYVATTGSDANPGSSASPFKTVQAAANIAKAGDTVLIGPGEYPEEVSTAQSGAADKPITFDGRGKAAVRRFIVNKPFNSIQNLRFSGITASSTRFSLKYIVHFYPGGHNAVVSNCFLDGGFAFDGGVSSVVGGVGWEMGSGVPLSSSVPNDCLIISNVITRVKGTQVLRINGRRNQFVLNTCTNLMDVDCIRAFGFDNSIRWNLFANIKNSADSGNHMDCFQTFGTGGNASSDIWIDGNTFRDGLDEVQICQLEAYSNPYIKNWTISNNQFINIGLGGHVLMPGVRFLNNVFYNVNNVAHALTFSYYDDPSRGGQATNCMILNNVFLACGDARSSTGWYSYFAHPMLVSTMVCNNNYVAKDGYAPVDAASTPSTFKFSESGGINGGDPKFESVARLDFRLAAGSPLIDKGATTSFLKVDAASRPRPANGPWEIGAFETASELATAPNPPEGLRVIP